VNWGCVLATKRGYHGANLPVLNLFRRRILLIKPGYPFAKSFPSRRRNAGHALLRNPIPEEGKPSFNPSNHFGENRRFHVLTTAQ